MVFLVFLDRTLSCLIVLVKELNLVGGGGSMHAITDKILI